MSVSEYREKPKNECGPRKGDHPENQPENFLLHTIIGQSQGYFITSELLIIRTGRSFLTII